MSVKIMNRVWEHSKQGGSARLLLLAIADNADDARGHAFPSIQTLAAKTLMSPRQIQRLVRELHTSGELAVKWGGLGRRKVNHYYVVVGMAAEQAEIIRQEVAIYNARQAALLADSVEKNKGDKLSPLREAEEKGDKMSPLAAEKGVKMSPLVRKGDIAMSDDPSVNVVEVVVGNEQAARDHFLGRKGHGYDFSEKDERELAALFADGFTLEQILSGINAAFDLPNKPYRFVQCARVTRQRFSPSGNPVTQSPAIRTTGIQTPETKPNAPDRPMPTELQQAVTTLAAIQGSVVSDRDVGRLRHLAELCDEVARKGGSTGYGWLSGALALTLTAEAVKSPIRYTESILRYWMTHGKGADLRPVREGYRTSRRAAAPAQVPVEMPEVNAGGETEFVNGVRMTRAEAKAFYANLRKEREKRRAATQETTREGA